MIEIFKKELEQHAKTFSQMESKLPEILKATSIIKGALKNGGKLLICGNGGSAGDAQHFSAELTGRYKKERPGMAAIALSTDTSALTAIGNDYGFEHVFSRQVEALGRPGDVLFGISTSGNSSNVIHAFKLAQTLGMMRIFLGGKDGGALREMADLAIVIGSDTPRIQEMHILIIHMICEALER